MKKKLAVLMAVVALGSFASVGNAFATEMQNGGGDNSGYTDTSGGGGYTDDQVAEIGGAAGERMDDTRY